MRRHGIFTEGNVVRWLVDMTGAMIAAMGAGTTGQWCAVMGTAAALEWLMGLLMLLGMLLPTLGMGMCG